MSTTPHSLPRLHNATWPGLVGKGDDGEPPIDLETLLDLTAGAEVDGVTFDGVDLFLLAPHVDIDSNHDQLQSLAERVNQRGLVIGTLVAPVWAPTGGGSAMGSPEERNAFLEQVKKSCRIAAELREMGVRPYGSVRIDSACSPGDWAADPRENQTIIAETFGRACDIAEDYGERLAAEGEICWGGMHSWKYMLELLERVDRPQTLGFQADMAHTLLYLFGYNAPEHALLTENFDWEITDQFYGRYKELADALRPWTIDFHVAQNDGSVFGAGSHDKTGKHCLPDDPNGKLDIPRAAGYWLRDAAGDLTKRFNHLCWDGCMFPNEVLLNPETWREVLSTMIAVRAAHGTSAHSTKRGLAPLANGSRAVQDR